MVVYFGWFDGWILKPRSGELGNLLFIALAQVLGWL